MKKALNRIVIGILAITFCLAAANAAEMHIEASDYLSAYTASADASGSGKVNINYTVVSYDSMTQIGASEVAVQQKVGSSWSTVKYFDAATTPGLLTSNRSSYSNTITYQGTSGKVYRAVVTVYAGDSTGHDTRDVTTSSVTA